MIASIGVGFRAGHDLHAALQLNQQNVHTRGGLIAIRAVVNDAGNGSRLRGHRCEQKQRGD